jgi:hypothetical protein
LDLVKLKCGPKCGDKTHFARDEQLKLSRV